MINALEARRLSVSRYLKDSQKEMAKLVHKIETEIARSVANKMTRAEVSVPEELAKNPGLISGLEKLGYTARVEQREGFFVSNYYKPPIKTLILSW